jgi:predicted lysophospholipase L1 biosynthesis ABC-type transport system permease subunit
MNATYPRPTARASTALRAALVRDGDEVLGLDLRLVCDRCAAASELSQFSDSGDLSVAYRALVELAQDAGWAVDKASGAVVCPTCR